jgi:hypothetical protein
VDWTRRSIPAHLDSADFANGIPLYLGDSGVVLRCHKAC